MGSGGASQFFTPPSLVQVIVNVIELDLACGSGGMFVQTSHFIEQGGQDTTHRVTFFGQEKTGTTIRLAKMNLAAHRLPDDKPSRKLRERSGHPLGALEGGEQAEFTKGVPSAGKEK